MGCRSRRLRSYLPYSNAGAKPWDVVALSGTRRIEPRFLNGLRPSVNRKVRSSNLGPGANLDSEIDPRKKSARTSATHVRFQHTTLDCPGGNFRSRAERQFVSDAVEMTLDCAFGQKQLVSDLPICAPAS